MKASETFSKQSVSSGCLWFNISSLGENLSLIVNYSFLRVHFFILLILNDIVTTVYQLCYKVTFYN